MFPSVVTATHTICYGQDEMACHLHPIICIWDAVTISTPVTIFFPLGVRLCLKKKKKENVQSVIIEAMSICVIGRWTCKSGIPSGETKLLMKQSIIQVTKGTSHTVEQWIPALPLFLSYVAWVIGSMHLKLKSSPSNVRYCAPEARYIL